MALEENIKTPKINLQIPLLNQSELLRPPSKELILQTFALPFLQTEIYRGKIPIATKDTSTIGRTSSLGTPIFSDLQFGDVNGIAHVPVDTALFNVNQAKNIVRTQIQGRDGQIKEYIGEDDFEINIKGIICGPNGVYPLQEVRNLVYFLRYQQSLKIISNYLNNVFDINEIVVKDYSFEQSEGSYSYQKFEINCWSEKPVEILISEGN